MSETAYQQNTKTRKPEPNGAVADNDTNTKKPAANGSNADTPRFVAPTHGGVDILKLLTELEDLIENTPKKMGMMFRFDEDKFHMTVMKIRANLPEEMKRASKLARILSVSWKSPAIMPVRLSRRTQGRPERVRARQI